MDVILRGAEVADGSGSARRRMDVGISDGRIAALGDLGSAAAQLTLDCSRRIVSPGFIDIHSHGDITPLVDPRCTSAVAQGITTVVVGNCGHGVAPRSDPALAPAGIIGYRRDWGVPLDWSSYEEYRDRLRERQPGVNLATLVPHGAVRLAVMGTAEDPADEAALARMEDMVAEAMAAGALGMSTGLEYVPGRSASQAELTRLARVAGHGAVYASHIRDRAERFADAVTEALEIGADSGCAVVLSHLAARPYAPPGAGEKVSTLLDEARDTGAQVVADTFPDEFGPSPLASVLPAWMVTGPPAEVTRRLRADGVIRQAIRSFEAGHNFLVRAEGAGGFMVTSSVAHPEACGHTTGELAELWGIHPAEVTCRLLADEGDDFYSLIIQHRYASRPELDRLCRDPWCAFESDGVLTSQGGPSSGIVMNRSTFGYAARVLGELVRERRMIALEEAVRRMTSLPAAAVGLRNRGRIGIGRPADLVVFDADAVADRSTDRQPARSPDGIDLVLVNGKVAHATGALWHAVTGGVAPSAGGQEMAKPSRAGQVLGPGD